LQQFNQSKAESPNRVQTRPTFLVMTRSPVIAYMTQHTEKQYTQAGRRIGSRAAAKL